MFKSMLDQIQFLTQLDRASASLLVKEFISCVGILGTRAPTVDNGSEVPHLPDIILIGHPDRTDLVKNFLP